MAVHCAKCGEELLGSVNRCWRCGQLLQVHAGPADVPPVRRAPLNLNQPPPLAAPAEPHPTSSLSPMRRGSPFASSSTSIPGQGIRPVRILAPEEMRQRKKGTTSVRLAGPVACLLGLISLLLSFAFPLGSFSIALAGVGFTLWGLYAPIRLWAWVALAVCGAMALFSLVLTVRQFSGL